VIETLLLPLKSSVTTSIVAVGPGPTAGDLAYLLQRPGLLVRSLVARYVPAPLAALALVVLLLGATTGSANACGLEDPSSIAVRRGALSLAYPQALHVGTAAWQAQLDGRLPPDPLALRGDLSPEGRGALRLLRANTLLRQFALKLEAPASATARPKLAVVLVGPVLWSRFEVDGATVRSSLHVAGPEPGDAVVVTEIAVIEAVSAGTLSLSEALAQGLVRLYGAEAVAARRWLLDPGGS
jgi:hypothetical protein